ncbi:hypothetical protein PRZ48_001656 [Zasmidium cellare]|uniref:Yeast cell wall synthesis Kre9/Knh1-like N-terminal domain-containing protein n=1 Tax=Zasmidium cellare TaxID=395010 RepID=A0ABR0F3J5_ZASCE|nr:hypothetical protein PRZ48_001656 [Zasmidium cellare]
MYIPRSFLVALVSAPFLAFAQDKPNPFNNPSGGYQVTAGQPLTLSWKPTTEGTVSLSLRMGNSGDLSQGTTFASNIPNSGSYTWQVPADTVRGSSYTIEIQSDSNPDETNYTPPFILESTNNAAPSSSGSSASTAASTVTPSSTRSSASASSDSATTSSPASTTGSSSASSSSASATDSSSSGSSSTATSSGSSSSASESSASSTNNADLQASASSSTQSSNGGAARATAMAGMLGVVALGALAL